MPFFPPRAHVLFTLKRHFTVFRHKFQVPHPPLSGKNTINEVGARCNEVEQARAFPHIPAYPIHTLKTHRDWKKSL